MIERSGKRIQRGVLMCFMMIDGLAGKKVIFMQKKRNIFYKTHPNFFNNLS